MACERRAASAIAALAAASHGATELAAAVQGSGVRLVMRRVASTRFAYPPQPGTRSVVLLRAAESTCAAHASTRAARASEDEKSTPRDVQLTSRIVGLQQSAVLVLDCAPVPGSGGHIEFKENLGSHLG